MQAAYATLLVTTELGGNNTTASHYGGLFCYLLLPRIGAQKAPSTFPTTNKESDGCNMRHIAQGANTIYGGPLRITLRRWRQRSATFRAAWCLYRLRFTVWYMPAWMYIRHRSPLRSTWLRQYSAMKQRAVAVPIIHHQRSDQPTSVPIAVGGVKPVLFNPNCISCGKKFVAEREAAARVMFPETKYNCLWTTCTHCQQQTMWFYGDTMPPWAAQYMPLRLDEVPSGVKEVYESAMGKTDKEEPEEQPTYESRREATGELTPRQEQLIAQLGETLDAMDDAALADLFSQPPPKSKLPERWK